MMRKLLAPFFLILVAHVALLLGCSEADSLSSVNMKAGMWEISTEIEASKMPMKMPPTVTKQCLTENDLVPKSNANQGNCDLSNLTTSGDVVAYTLTCSAGGAKTVSKATVKYQGTTMDGVIETVMTGGPADMSMTYRMKGERVGDCP